jgi:protocatechuate 3,4-dioxygenase beta subunit
VTGRAVAAAALAAALLLPSLGLAADAGLPATSAAPPVVVVAPDGEPGERLVVRGRIVAGGAPAAGAAIHVYQTDVTGAYTKERPMDEPNARLAGRVTTDADGRFEVRTIRPGEYPRTVVLGGVARHIPAHIHLDVRVAGHPERKLQAVFADDPLLADPYWREWVAERRQPVLAVRREGSLAVAELVLDVAK